MKNSIKELQQKTLEILRVFIDTCEKLNVKYYLIDGTLLGAVRHKGFIPWDDDIDVGMIREDYEKFLKEAPALLPESFFLQTYESDPGYQHNFAKIRNSNTTFIESSLADKKINHGLFLDIFPLYECEKEYNVSRKFNIKRAICNLRISYLYNDNVVSKKARLVRPITKLFFSTAQKALRAEENLFKTNPDGKFLANYNSLWGEKETVPKEWFGEGVTLEFEGIKVICPTEYEKWLTNVYGDYMKLPPEEKRVTHHNTEIIDLEKSYTEYIK